MAKEMNEVQECEEQEGRVNIGEIAANAVMESDGDTAAGAAYVLRVLRTQYPVYYAQKSSEAMLLWAQDVIRGARTRLRSQIAWAPKGVQTKAGSGAMSSGSLGDLATAYMTWPVLPGILLANATREDLMQAVDKYRGDADTYLRRAGWLNAIAESLPDDESPVADVLDESAVASLARQYKV